MPDRPHFAFCPVCVPTMPQAIDLMPAEFGEYFHVVPCPRHAEDCSRVLWLDDTRPPWKYGYIGAEWVKTAAAAIEALRNGKYALASLDHDLGPEHYPWSGVPIDQCRGTGYDVALWLEQHPEFLPKEVRVHSMNPAGAERMRVAIASAYRRLGGANERQAASVV